MTDTGSEPGGTFTIHPRCSGINAVKSNGAPPRPKARKPTKDAVCVSIRLPNNQVGVEAPNWLSHVYIAYLMTFCESVGLSTFTVNASKSITLRAAAFGYTVIVFTALSVYSFALILVLFSDTGESPTSHTSPLRFHRQFAAIFSLFGLYLNIRLHQLTASELKQLTECSAADKRVLEKKDGLLRLLCIVATGVVILVPLVVVIVRISLIFASYGQSEYLPLLPCGVVCYVFDEYVLYMCVVSLLVVSSFFLIFSFSLCFDAKDLLERIRSCGGGSYIDHLIFRFQALERCIRTAERHFSVLLLLLLVMCGFASVFSIRQARHSEDFVSYSLHHLTVLLCTILLLLATAILILVSTTVNSQVSHFQTASYKVGDLQQIQLSASHAVKLLVFMLRLSGERNFLTVGGLFVASRQNVLLMLFFVSLSAVAVFLVDENCVRIF